MLGRTCAMVAHLMRTSWRLDTRAIAVIYLRCNVFFGAAKMNKTDTRQGSTIRVGTTDSIQSRVSDAKKLAAFKAWLKGAEIRRTAGERALLARTK